MPRETYSRSDETFKVLSEHEAEFAREADKDVSYFNKIKNGGEPDRYAPFRALFRIGCRTTAPVEIWLNDLMAIFVRSRSFGINASELSAKLLEKIKTDSEETSALVDAISDGKLDKAECYRILSHFEKSESLKNELKKIVLHRLGEITEKESK